MQLPVGRQAVLSFNLLGEVLAEICCKGVVFLFQFFRFFVEMTLLCPYLYPSLLPLSFGVFLRCGKLFLW